MDLRTTVLLGFAVPVVVSAVTAALASRQHAKDAPTAAFRAGLGMTIAFWAGWAILRNIPPQELPWLPREASQWLLWAPVLASVAALCFGFMTEGGGRVILMVILVSAFALPQVRPLWQGAWKPIEAIWLTGLVLALGVLGWAMLARLAREVRPAPAMFWCTALLTLTAVAVVASGSASLAQTTGLFAAATGPLLLIAWWRPEAGVFGLAPSLTALAMLGVLINARFYSELGVLATLLILASPVLTWALVRFGPGESGGAAWLKCLAGLAPAAVAAGLAVHAALQTKDQW